MWAVGWAHLSKGIILLQRVIAVALAVLGLGVTGAAIASGTVWAPSSVVSASGTLGEPTTMAVTAPGVLALLDGPVAVTATRKDGGPVSLAIGRENDVVGWVGADAHASITGLTSWSGLQTSFIPGTTTPGASGSGLVGPDPSASDMWLVAAQGEGTATLTWNGVQGRDLLLVANTGDDAPPPHVTLTWDREVSTPLMIPGIVLGILTLLVGLVLLMRAARLTQPHPGRLGAATAPRTERATREDRFVEVADRSSRLASGTTTVAGSTHATGAEATASTGSSVTLDEPTLVVVPSLSSTGTPHHPSGPRDAADEAGPADRSGAGNAAPMSRRELRELAAREAEQAARARKTPRTRRGQGPDESAATPAPRTGTTPRTLLRALTGAQPIVPAPSAKPVTHDGAADADSPNRADAWRKAWGFDGLDAGTPDDAADSPETTSQETP